ncbi:flagellar basal body rod protein FlgB [Alkalicoccus urumqiensis]|uniref:Flagellar basal body rod protein FlgB n=1 Tax=Alkalicoccus urumqiensis TaxID=1548213 RepID=A0A2P6MG13_ALKUR|nr:flagellar basal body rod protein FlgB [Alkalicoccus urumqiensis]PRO65235.1 flagellar basal body rod protein FlgB [Alkalicoccus urumqiensis]
MNLLNNDSMNLLETAVQASSKRQNTIANNIANADTPGYKAERTVFRHQLAEAEKQLEARQTDQRHIPFSQNSGSMSPEVKKRMDTAYNHNGNNVDIDHEMSMMAENQIYYNAVVERLSGKFNSVRTALGSGR